MTTTAQPDAPLQSKRVNVESLTDGQRLIAPVYDDAGVLLLAAGSIITPSIKAKLQARNITFVILSGADVAAMRLGDLRSEIVAPKSLFDSSHTERLGSIIKAGNLFVANSGPAVKDRLVLHGCKAYDPKLREKILERHQEASEKLDEMFGRALHGEKIDSRQLATYVGTYVGALSKDPDSVMAAAAQMSQDTELSDHCLKSCVLAMALGIELDLDDAKLRDLGLCGLLHDWGMIHVPESIRRATHPLTAGEFMHLQKHPAYTLQMLDGIQGDPKVVAIAAYQVHERPNGKGYPRRRRHTQIHLFARILGVATTYTALTAPRPYRPALMPYSAMECLIRQSQSGDADAEGVRALLHVLSLFPIGSFVLLDDGSVAIVMRRSGTNYTSPIVRLTVDSEGNLFDPNDDSFIIDLSTHERRVVQAVPSPDFDQISFHEEILTEYQ